MPRLPVLTRIQEWFHVWSRRRKARWIIQFIKRHGIRTVLLVGSTGLATRRAFENAIEREIAVHADMTVFSGISRFGAASYVCADGRALPFADGSFDLVYSNAVIEHVGDAADQRRFAAEHRRVGRHWALTTPNRWFPVEAHTHAVFRHWRPAWRARQTTFTQLLSRRELRAISQGNIVGHAISPTLTAWGTGGTAARSGDRLG